MNIQLISSEDNKIIKHINSLKLRKYRKKNNQFIVEGFRIICECIKTSPDIIDYIVLSSSALESEDGKSLIRQIPKAIYEVSDRLFNKITDTDNPQGMMAIVKMAEHNMLDIITENNSIYVILDRIQDPGNMGTIIRTASGINAKAIILTKGCVDPYNSKTVRATMGAIFNIPILEAENNLEWIRLFRDNNIRLIGSSLNTQKNYLDADYTGNIGIIIGNEANGIEENLLKEVDEQVYIPIIGSIESLNASVAAGVLFYKALEGRLK